MTAESTAAEPGRHLRLVTSNRLDILVDRLAELFATDPLSPLEREVVVVQSQGMQRWLTLELARRAGISASLTTPFPRPYCNHLARCLLDGEASPPSEDIPRAQASLFGQEMLAWRIFSELGRVLADGPEPAFAVPAAYLEDDPDQRKRFQLAHRLAALFDGYQLFRAELLAGWLEGDDLGGLEPGAGQKPSRAGSAPRPALARDVETTARWQARLWRRLVERIPEPRPAPAPATPSPATPSPATTEPLDLRLRRLIELLHRAETRPAGLPRRLTVLGVSSLPPVFVELLVALSRFVPVGIYFVSPTYHYWGDLRSEREQARMARRGRRSAARGSRSTGDGPGAPEAFDPGTEHLEEGHPLLAALGRQGRDFFELLQRSDPTGSAWQELDFVDPAPALDETVLAKATIENPGIAALETLPRALHVLQSDILHLRRRDPSAQVGSPTGRVPLDQHDDSIEIHSCHSPMREMEVLRDRLLDAFERDPDLRPSGVLVLMPDIELYGPYIQAVFGVRRPGSPRLPFSIADRRAGRERPPSETFLEILELVGARLTLRQVFDLLDVPAVRRRFEIGAEALPALRRQVAEAGVRWAIDGEHKATSFDLPADPGSTWRQGLDRLLVGYAAGDLDRLVAGVLPRAGHTAGMADELGRFATFVDTLFEHAARLRAPRSLEAWAHDLGRALDDLFLAEDEAEERGLQWVRDTIYRLHEAGQRLDLHDPVDLRVVQEHLRRGLEVEGFGSGFFDGTITFCALRPMRTIPFRIICVCGLDDGAFPRLDRRRSFDLMGRFPRLGDRSLREDDRYLFLETLLAAEQRLLLSYVGRSQRDASRKEPSVVLAELLDQLDRTFVDPDSNPGSGAERPARERLGFEHRLQPWNPDYFRAAPVDEVVSAGETSADHPDSLGWSYSRDDARGAESLLREPTPMAPFVAEPLPQLDPEAVGLAHDEPVEVDDLARFWLLPARWFCRQRLQIELERAVDEIPEHEPFAIEGLDSYRWRQWLLQRRLRARQADTDASAPGGDERAEAGSQVARSEPELLRAAGALPAGLLGEQAYRRLARRVDAFVDRLPPFRAAPDRSIDVAGDGWRLVGGIDSQTTDGTLYFRCTSLRPADLLRGWIAHLAAAADDQQHSRPTTPTRIVAEDAAVHFAVPENPRQLLAWLIEGYRRGATRPLPVFPNASHRYAEHFLAGLDPRSKAKQSPLEAARAAFEPRFVPGNAPPPEADDPWVRLAFRGIDPLELESFPDLALGLWRPLLEHRDELELARGTAP